jgi:signal transduction histidine kinase
VTLLQDLLAVAFTGLTAAAAWQWYRHRARPARFLVGAFGVITLASLSGLIDVPDGAGASRLLSAASLAALCAFPWFLAAFAWSFQRRLPTWLWGVAVGVVAVAVFGIVLAPFPDADAWRAPHVLFLVLFLVGWGALSMAAATRLWTAGGRLRLVRSRVRAMASGMAAMVAALLTSVLGSTTGTATSTVAQLFALLAAGLFVAGFAPPTPLRLWWRRRATEQFQDLQVALIAAATADEIGRAVVPMLADLLGGGVALVTEDGRILAAAGMPDDGERVEVGAADDVRPDARGNHGAGRDLSIPIDGMRLLVRPTAYTPVFGHDEHELLSAFALQIRLAVERAALLEAHQTARSDAERANEELESMLLGLSHDLRSPAIAIAGFATLLAETDDPEARAEMLDRIQASATYLNDLVDALLELARVGRAESGAEPVDLTAVADLVARRAGGSHPNAVVEVAGPLPVVSMDPRRAEQLLDNLVTNALKHGGRDELHVLVSSRPSTHGVELLVDDDGRGVAPEDRERVFALFQRGPSAGGRGSGLGLGMVRRIAEHGGGRVWIEDRSLGARFVVTFPADQVIDARVRERV